MANLNFNEDPNAPGSGSQFFYKLIQEHDKNDWLFGMGADDIGNLVTQGGDGLSDQPKMKVGNDSFAFGSTQWLEAMFEQSGLPESYRTAFMNNPGVQAYLSISKNKGLGKLLHNWGFNTGRDKARADAKVKAFDYIQSLINQYRMDTYNSPLAAGSRERLAGGNPALLGFDKANSSADMPFSGVDEGISDNLSTAGSDLANAASVASPLISLLSNVANVKHLAYQNKLLDKQSRSVGVSTDMDIIDIAENAAHNSITSDSFDHYKADGEKFLDASFITGYGVAGNYGFTDPREVTLFNNAYNRYYHSVFTDYDSYKAYVGKKALEYEDRAFSYRLENGAPELESSLMLDKLRIEQKYAEWELDLQKTDDFETLWKSKLPAEIKADVSEALLSSIQDDTERAALQQALQNGVVNEMSKEMVQSLKTQIQVELTQMKDNELLAKDIDAMDAFLRGERPAAPTRREARRRKRGARRQYRTRYGRSAYMESWHPALLSTGLSWFDASNYDD